MLVSTVPVKEVRIYSDPCAHTHTRPFHRKGTSARQHGQQLHKAAEEAAVEAPEADPLV